MFRAYVEPDCNAGDHGEDFVIGFDAQNLGRPLEFAGVPPFFNCSYLTRGRRQRTLGFRGDLAVSEIEQIDNYGYDRCFW